MLNRSADTSRLRTWALKLKERLSFKRAAVALARKLAMIMHAMLNTGELFAPHAGAPTTFLSWRAPTTNLIMLFHR